MFFMCVAVYTQGAWRGGGSSSQAAAVGLTTITIAPAHTTTADTAVITHTHTPSHLCRTFSTASTARPCSAHCTAAAANARLPDGRVLRTCACSGQWQRRGEAQQQRALAQARRPLQAAAGPRAQAAPGSRHRSCAGCT